jgi:hypothetical protein
MSTLYSPVYDPQQKTEACMIFSYNIWGNEKQGLKLYIDNFDNSTETELLWNVIGPLKIDKWYTAKQTISNAKYKRFQVRVQAKFKI